MNFICDWLSRTEPKRQAVDSKLTCEVYGCGLTRVEIEKLIKSTVIELLDLVVE